MKQFGVINVSSEEGLDSLTTKLTEISNKNNILGWQIIREPTEWIAVLFSEPKSSYDKSHAKEEMIL